MTPRNGPGRNRNQRGAELTSRESISVPDTTDLVDRFLRESAAAEDLRQRRTWIIVVTVLAILSTLAIVAGWLAIQTNRQASDLKAAAATDTRRLVDLSTSQAETEQQRDLALSRQLAAQSQSQMESQLDLALLLAVEANQIAHTAQARHALLASLQVQPRLLSMVRSSGGSVTDLAFSPDGRWLAAASCDTGSGSEGDACFGPAQIEVWDTSDPASPTQWIIPLGTSETVAGLAISSGAQMLAFCDFFEKAIVLWDLSEPDAPARSLIPLSGELDCTYGLAVSPEGTISARYGADDPDVAALEDQGLDVAGSVCSQDWSLCVGTACTDWTGEVCAQSQIAFWDMSHPERGRERSFPVRPLPGEVFGRAARPDGRLVALGGCNSRESSGSCRQGQVWLFDTSDRPSPAAELWAATLEGPSGFLTHLAFRPDSELLASAGCATHQEYDQVCPGADEVRLWRVPAAGQAQPVGSPFRVPRQPITGLAFDQDRRLLAACSEDGSLALWDLADPTAPIQGDQPTAGEVDCRSPFTLDADGVISAAAGESVHLPAPLTDGPGATVVSPDGKTAATFFRDITLWDLSGSGSPLQPGQPLLGFQNFRFVAGLAFSPDSTLMAAATCVSMDGEFCTPSGLYLWDVSDPRSPLLLSEPAPGPTGEHVDLSFSPDGTTLAATSYRALMLWDVSLESWQARACRLAGRSLTEDERQRFFGDRDYRPVCPGPPIPEETPAP